MDNQVKEDQKRRAQEERGTWIRLTIVSVLLLGLYGALGINFYKIQSDGSHLIQSTQVDLKKRAEKQSTGRMTLGAGGESAQDGHRGYIYDRHGYELAISVETPSVFVHPKQIEDVDLATTKLSKALEMDREEVRKKLTSDSPFVWLVRKTTPEKGKAVKDLKLRGVGTKRESKRYYPGQELAGQILGFVGLDNVGLEGIESAYDKYLRGDVLRIKDRRDVRGNIILTADTPRLNELEGSSIVLTLDQYIQKVAETALDRTCRNFSAKGGLAVVIDPFTGEVLAMANWPRFNPNRFSDYRKEDMRNRAVLDAYEPGSMMKTITYASAVEGAHVRPHDPIDQNHAHLKIGKYTISDTHSVPNMTAETVVSESSNIGAYHLAQKIGRDKFYEYLRAFGFGSRTGINIAGESAGILWPPKNWAEITFANMAFGHGVSVSPLQMAVAVSAIANGGKRMKPWIIKEIRDHEGNIVQQGKPEMVKQVISEKTAAQVRQAMERVVAEGTAMRAWVSGYRVGGKTGTAQKVVNRHYSNQYMANFVGIAPINDPNIVVIVMIDAPKPQHSGGFVAAPVFSEIASQVLPYRGVYPKNVADGILNPFDTVADAAVVQRVNASNENIPAVQSCDDFVTVPDFRGMTAMKSLEMATSACLGVNMQNSGFVTSQYPAAGTRVSAHSRVELTMRGNYRALDK